MDDPNSRKRPRSAATSTKRASLDLLLPSSDSQGINSDHHGRQQAANLRNPMIRNTELNNLLRLSCSQESFSMKSNAISEALAEIVVVDCLGWKQGMDCPPDKGTVFRSTLAWKQPPTMKMQAWADCCLNVTISDDDVWKTLEAVAVILRNLSYAGNNLRLLAYSTSTSCVLTAILYISASRTYKEFCQRRDQQDLTLATSALQTLLHLARYLDVTGQQIVVDKLFYDGASGPLVPNIGFGMCLTGEWGGLGACWLAKKLDSKEDTMENLPTNLLIDIAGDYLVAVWSLFPAIGKILTEEKLPRSVVLLSLDVLVEFLTMARVGLVGSLNEEDAVIKPGTDYEVPKLRAVLAQIPDTVLCRLTEALNIPKTGNDSIDFTESLTRVTPNRYLQGYDIIVDADVRDRALEVLVLLLELDSPRMATRLGKTMPFLSLLPILTATTGRTDASSLAAQTLKELSHSQSNTVRLLAIQPHLVELASRNPKISVWEDLYPIVEDDDRD